MAEHYYTNAPTSAHEERHVSVQLGNMRIPVHSVMAKELKTGQTSIQVSIGINDLNQLQTIINNLSRIQGVVSVKRAVLS